MVYIKIENGTKPMKNRILRKAVRTVKKASTLAIKEKQFTYESICKPLRKTKYRRAKISENDGLPSKICESCLQSVNLFYDFKIQCEISEETLRNYLASQQHTLKSYWNHGSPSGNKTKEEHQPEQLINFTECKTEIDIADYVKLEPEDVTADFCTTQLENSMEQPQKEKKNVEASKEVEEEKSADAPAADEHCTPTNISQENCFKQSQKERKKKHISQEFRVSVPELSEKEEVFDCAICGKHFKQKCLLRKHLIRHEGARPHVCTTCGRRFTSKCNLKTHLLLHTGQRSHVCDICGKQFTLASYLKTHATVHSGAKPHMCEICGKSYTQVSSLRQHAMKHSGERPFICEICHKTYSQKKSLEIHIATHTGARPYICNICGNNFAQPSSLKSHIRSHTGIRRFVCSVCGIGYTKKKNLEKHVARNVSCQNADESEIQSSDTKD